MSSSTRETTRDRWEQINRIIFKKVKSLFKISYKNLLRNSFDQFFKPNVRRLDRNIRGSEMFFAVKKKKKVAVNYECYIHRYSGVLSYVEENVLQKFCQESET